MKESTNERNQSIISFDIINLIYSYLKSQQRNFEFKVKGINETVLVNLYYFATSLDSEEAKAEIKKAGYNNSSEVLNELYKKMNIKTLSQETIEEGLTYDFIHIQFYSEPTEDEKKFFNSSIKNFIIFFCCTNSLEVNNFKILYSG